MRTKRTKQTYKARTTKQARTNVQSKRTKRTKQIQMQSVLFEIACAHSLVGIALYTRVKPRIVTSTTEFDITFSINETGLQLVRIDPFQTKNKTFERSKSSPLCEPKFKFGGFSDHHQPSSRFDE